MTRFLPRVWDDPQCASFNEETERLYAYHQATKHTYYSVRENAHYLDWNNQPDPFRIYEGAPATVLAPEPGFPDAGTFGAMGALGGRSRTTGEIDFDDSNPIQLDAVWLSRLLWHSMAISAWKKIPSTGSRYSLRVNPSSGNLHPTETYLALNGFTDVDDGLYHYRADRHALELRSPGAWTQHLAEALLIPWAAESSLIVGLTSIFWREAWKYRDRAYRYCCHDLGHAMMSLLLAARALGLPGGAIAHFADSRLTRALGLTGGDEAPMAFLVFGSNNPSAQVPTLSQEAFIGVPNELSTEEVPYELLLGIHRSTILPDTADPTPHLPAANPAMAGDRPPLLGRFRNAARDSNLGVIARRRRSALDFDARTPPMERSEMEQLLDYATRDWRADWRGNFGGEGAEAGRAADFVTLYLYAYLSLEQALAGNACLAVSMVADLAAAAKIFGNRGYRYVHFEAGAIGQRLYLGAEALGWNATGIGAFYDDDVHRYLGFLEETDGSVSSSVDAAEQRTLVMLGSPASRIASAISDSGDDPFSGNRQARANEPKTAPRGDSSKLSQQVIYHFAIGRAIPDPRLEA